MNKEIIEITVQVFDTYENLVKKLKNQKFKITEQFYYNDIYMIPINIDIYKTNDYDILKKVVLLRNRNNNIFKLVHKEKKINNKEEIISEQKIECIIDNIENAKKILEKLGFKQLFIIKDKCTELSNGQLEILVQQIENQGIYIEIEQQKYHKKWSRKKIIEDLIEQVNNLNLNIGNNYFVNKALIKLRKIKKEN